MDKIIDLTTKTSIENLAAKLSALPPEAREIVYHTVNGMALLVKAQERKKSKEVTADDS